VAKRPNVGRWFSTEKPHQSTTFTSLTCHQAKSRNCTII